MQTIDTNALKQYQSQQNANMFKKLQSSSQSGGGGYTGQYKSNLGDFLQNYMSNRLRSGLPSYASKPAENKIAQAYNSRMNVLRQSGADRGLGGSGGMYNAMATLDTGRMGALGDVMSNMALQNLQYQQSMLQGLGGLETQNSTRDMQLRQLKQTDYWNQKQMEAQEGGAGDFFGGLLGLGVGALTGGLGGSLGSKLGNGLFGSGGESETGSGDVAGWGDFTKRMW